MVARNGHVLALSLPSFPPLFGMLATHKYKHKHKHEHNYSV